MDEPLFMNYKPVNRKAKRFLMQEGQQPNPAYLYVLQLAVWGPEKGGLRKTTGWKTACGQCSSGTRRRS